MCDDAVTVEREQATIGSAGQWMLGKSFDASGSWGPQIVTVDEAAPGAENLAIATRLNGEVMQAAPTSDLIFDIPTLIEYCSTFARLEPGRRAA